MLAHGLVSDRVCPSHAASSDAFAGEIGGGTGFSERWISLPPINHPFFLFLIKRRMKSSVEFGPIAIPKFVFLVPVLEVVRIPADWCLAQQGVDEFSQHQRFSAFVGLGGGVRDRNQLLHSPHEHGGLCGRFTLRQSKALSGNR